MKRILLAAGVLLSGAGALFSLRKELNRYLRIKRMAGNPALVGASITPQGNEAALNSSPNRRRQDREHAGVRPGQPTDPEMPNLRPGDQAG